MARDDYQPIYWYDNHPTSPKIIITGVEYGQQSNLWEHPVRNRSVDFVKVVPNVKQRPVRHSASADAVVDRNAVDAFQRQAGRGNAMSNNTDDR
jgi:hypothetical protein